MSAMDIAIILGRAAHDSRVLINGIDMSEGCRGVEVRAFVGEVTHVTLHLIGRCEITGEVERVDFHHPEAPPTEGESE